jgi:hypothetical protein
MRLKRLNNKPDLKGNIEIEVKKGYLGFQYIVKCNGRAISVYTDFYEAIQKVKNGIYGYPVEYIAI